MQNAHADAEQAFAQAARLNPRSPDAHAYLGLACMKQGKDEQAVAAFKAALDIQALGDGAGEPGSFRYSGIQNPAASRSIVQLFYICCHHLHA